jgi:hypothetical protein
MKKKFNELITDTQGKETETSAKKREVIRNYETRKYTRNEREKVCKCGNGNRKNEEREEVEKAKKINSKLCEIGYVSKKEKKFIFKNEKMNMVVLMKEQGLKFNQFFKKRKN